MSKNSKNEKEFQIKKYNEIKNKEKHCAEEIDLDEEDQEILDSLWKERQEETRKKLEEARKKKDKNK